MVLTQRLFILQVQILNKLLEGVTVTHRKKVYVSENLNALSEGVHHFRSVVMDAGSRGTTAHAHQCLYNFQGHPKADRREWNGLCVSQHPWQRTRGHGEWRHTPTAYDYLQNWQVLHVSQPITCQNFSSSCQKLSLLLIKNYFYEKDPGVSFTICKNLQNLGDNNKRKQLFKMIFLVNEQNVSVMYIDFNAISFRFDLNIFQQDECFCSKLGLEVEHAKSNLKNISISDFDDLSLASFCQSRPQYAVEVMMSLPASTWHAHFQNRVPSVNLVRELLHCIAMPCWGECTYIHMYIRTKRMNQHWANLHV